MFKMVLEGGRRVPRVFQGFLEAIQRFLMGFQGRSKSVPGDLRNGFRSIPGSSRSVPGRSDDVPRGFREFLMRSMGYKKLYGCSREFQECSRRYHRRSRALQGV